MLRRTAFAAATLAALTLAAPAARGDTLTTPAPRAVNLATGGGYQAWLAPLEDTGWQLTVRRPDGTVDAPAIPFFPGTQRFSVGSGGFDTDRHPLIALHRPSGGDDDLYTVDLVTGRQSRVGPISSRSYDEGPAAVKYGAFVFVRRGGRRDGTYYWSGKGSSRRISTVTPTQVVTNGSRAAYWKGRTVAVRTLSGRGPLLTFRSPGTVRNVLLTRYRVIWLTADGQVFQSDRFGGSGQRSTAVARPGKRRLAGAQSIADDGSTVTTYLDAEGVKSITPPLFD